MSRDEALAALENLAEDIRRYVYDSRRGRLNDRGHRMFASEVARVDFDRLVETIQHGERCAHGVVVGERACTLCPPSGPPWPPWPGTTED